MEMFLMLLSLSVVGVLVSGVLFAAAARDVRRREGLGLCPAALQDEERFFMMRPAMAIAPPVARLPAEMLRLRIERHVRLEQAAAESFLQFPSVEALHMRTLSPLAR